MLYFSLSYVGWVDVNMVVINDLSLILLQSYINFLYFQTVL